MISRNIVLSRPNTKQLLNKWNIGKRHRKQIYKFFLRKFIERGKFQNASQIGTRERFSTIANRKYFRRPKAQKTLSYLTLFRKIWSDISKSMEKISANSLLISVRRSLRLIRDSGI